MSTTTRTIPYRRRREDKTNYHKRIALLKSNKLRLVVRRTLKNMVLQLVEYHPTGDKVVVAAHTRELEKFDWKYGRGNLPSAYLLGLVFGKKALAKKYKEAIVDFGLQGPVKGTRLFAAVKGVVDAGVHIPHDAKMFPSEDRVKGQHIAHNTFVKNPASKDIPTRFEQCKEKILKG